MGARLRWHENLDMVALLEKVYEHYSSVKYPAVRQPMLMELKWAAAFTFDQLRNAFKPAFGKDVSYADRTYSAFCQIDTRFRMRKGFGKEERADVREAERTAARYWRVVREEDFLSPYHEDWPEELRKIYLADKRRRNAAASKSNAARRIADDKRAVPTKREPAADSQLFTCTLLGLGHLAEGLMKHHRGDTLVSLQLVSL